MMTKQQYKAAAAMIREANAQGYTREGGLLPLAACGRCGGWRGSSGMDRHIMTLEPVLGRYGCTCSMPSYFEAVAKQLTK